METERNGDREKKIEGKEMRERKSERYRGGGGVIIMSVIKRERERENGKIEGENERKAQVG